MKSRRQAKNKGDKFIESVLGLSRDDARKLVLDFVSAASETSYDIKFIRRGWLYTLDFEDGKCKSAGRRKFESL